MYFKTVVMLLGITTQLCMHASDPEVEDFISIAIDTNNIQTLPLHDVIDQRKIDYATIPTSTPLHGSRTMDTRFCTTGTGLGGIIGGVSGGAIGTAIAPTLYAMLLGSLTGFFLGGVAGGCLSMYLFKAHYNGPCWCKSNS